MLHWDTIIWQQVLGFLLFIALVAAVFLSSTAIVVEIFVYRVQKKHWHPLSLKDKSLLLLGGTGVLCILYGYSIEPYWPSVETVRLSSRKLHPSGRPIRIVQISDLHCDDQPRLEDGLPDIIAAQKPDVIVFTGDALNSSAGLPIFRRCLTQLAKIAPTYVVKGNWDAWYFKNLDRFGNTGARELDGDPVKVLIAGNDIWFAGLPVGTTKSVSDVMHNVPSNAYRIFLFHYPDYLKEMERNNIDLYLAGHTHGGQVALPFYGALITLSTTGKRYESGLYKLGNTHLYVNRGIGMEGGTAPRVRFCARPEITVIEIYGSP